MALVTIRSYAVDACSFLQLKSRLPLSRACFVYVSIIYYALAATLFAYLLPSWSTTTADNYNQSHHEIVSPTHPYVEPTDKSIPPKHMAMFCDHHSFRLFLSPNLQHLIQPLPFPECHSHQTL